MIDRRTGLICVMLIAIMFAAAVWRIIMVEDWTVLAIQHREAGLSWLPFFFPAASAFVVGRLYWSRPRTSADGARVQRWRTWGAFFSISYCALLLLLQATIIVISALGMHPYLWAIYRGLGVLLGIMILVAVNQWPKLPYFEENRAWRRLGTNLRAEVCANQIQDRYRVRGRGDCIYPRGDPEHELVPSAIHSPCRRIFPGLEHRLAASFGSQMET